LASQILLRRREPWFTLAGKPLRPVQAATRISLLFLATFALAQSDSLKSPSFLGFDRNEYPGDENLRQLRNAFAYTGYWLNNPPGANANTWAGKRATIESMGFGFLVLFNGRVYAELRDSSHAAALGQADAQQAIEAAHRIRPDVIVLDLAMPKLDGWEVCRRLKADPATRGIPIIVVTSYALSGDDVKAFEAGCDAYVTKPFVPRDLLAKVRSYLK